MRNANLKNRFFRFIAHLFTKYSSHMRIFYTPHESKPSTLIHNLTVLTNSCPSPQPPPHCPHTSRAYVQFPWHKIYALLARKRDRKKCWEKGTKIIMENVLCMCNKANWKSEMNWGGISTLYTIYMAYIYIYACCCVCVCVVYINISFCLSSPLKAGSALRSAWLHQMQQA